MFCQAMRVQDEFYCDLCHLRWDAKEEKPPCNPPPVPPGKPTMRQRWVGKRNKKFKYR